MNLTVFFFFVFLHLPFFSLSDCPQDISYGTGCSNLCSSCVGSNRQCYSGLLGKCGCSTGYSQSLVDSSCFIPCISSSSALLNGVIGIYHFDSLLNSVSTSGSLNSLSAIGSPVFTNGGLNGKASSVTGNNYFLITPASALNDFTYAIWLEI
jgi:hypothetical protein